MTRKPLEQNAHIRTADTPVKTHSSRLLAQRFTPFSNHSQEAVFILSEEQCENQGQYLIGCEWSRHDILGSSTFQKM
jgi:hypothetical protein